MHDRLLGVRRDWRNLRSLQSHLELPVLGIFSKTEKGGLAGRL